MLDKKIMVFAFMTELLIVEISRLLKKKIDKLRLWLKILHLVCQDERNVIVTCRKEEVLNFLFLL